LSARAVEISCHVVRVAGSPRVTAICDQVRPAFRAARTDSASALSAATIVRHATARSALVAPPVWTSIAPASSSRSERSPFSFASSGRSGALGARAPFPAQAASRWTQPVVCVLEGGSCLLRQHADQLAGRQLAS
jgi:hypothetical protein